MYCIIPSQTEPEHIKSHSPLNRTESFHSQIETSLNCIDNDRIVFYPRDVHPCFLRFVHFEPAFCFSNSGHFLTRSQSSFENGADMMCVQHIRVFYETVTWEPQFSRDRTNKTGKIEDQPCGMFFILVVSCTFEAEVLPRPQSTQMSLYLLALPSQPLL